MVRGLVVIFWGMWSFVLLHPIWLELVDGPEWVGPVDVIGPWDAPWWIRHSYIPFWLACWLVPVLMVWVMWGLGVSVRRWAQRLVPE